MQDLAKKHKMVIVVPMYEEDLPGIYYNSAAVIDATGEYLGKFRKIHIPHCNPGFWEKFYFRPGNMGYPVFDTKIGKVGVYICYDRHFPDGARCLGLNGAEIVFNPSATVAGLSEYLWKLEQPAHAVANQYFVGAINRPGWEEPWRIGEFYGQSYFVNPRGQFIAAEREADRGRHRHRRHGLRHDPRSPQHLAILPRPPAGNLRAQITASLIDISSGSPDSACGARAVTELSSASVRPSTDDRAKRAARDHVADEVVVHRHKRHEHRQPATIAYSQRTRGIASQNTDANPTISAPSAPRESCRHRRQLETDGNRTRQYRSATDYYRATFPASSGRTNRQAIDETDPQQSS